MKRLQKLIRLADYFSGFAIPEYPEIQTLRVVDSENATSVLARAAGDQLLIALPESQEHGSDTDTFSSTVSTAIFVLAKINGPARTQTQADEAYARLLQLAQEVLERISADLTGEGLIDPCPLLAGLSLTDVNIAPEYSIFGGWSGWAIELTLS